MQQSLIGLSTSFAVLVLVGTFERFWIVLSAHHGRGLRAGRPEGRTMPTQDIGGSYGAPMRGSFGLFRPCPSSCGSQRIVAIFLAKIALSTQTPAADGNRRRSLTTQGVHVHAQLEESYQRLHLRLLDRLSHRERSRSRKQSLPARGPSGAVEGRLRRPARGRRRRWRTRRRVQRARDGAAHRGSLSHNGARVALLDYDARGEPPPDVPYLSKALVFSRLRDPGWTPRGEPGSALGAPARSGPPPWPPGGEGGPGSREVPAQGGIIPTDGDLRGVKGPTAF